MLARHNPVNIEWLSALKNRLMAIACQTASSRPAITSFQRLRSFLDCHWQEQISLEEMAKQAKTGKFQLLRKFSAATGVTPYRYLENVRLLKAQKLLQSGAGLADCAASAGYYDQSHFNRCFKANMGITPGGYRRSWSAPAC